MRIFAQKEAAPGRLELSLYFTIIPFVMNIDQKKISNKHFSLVGDLRKVKFQKSLKTFHTLHSIT